MNRTHAFRRTVYGIALIALLTVDQASAQQPYLDMAPLRFSLGALGTADAWTTTVGVDRSIPLHFFLPNVGRNSHVDVLDFAAGIRVDEDRVIPRYRIIPLELTISRPPWNGGVRLLAYDRAGTRDVVADWLAIHAGPSVRFNAGSIVMEPRIELTGSFATRRIGRSFFPDLPESAAHGATGAAGGVKVALTITLSEGAYIEADTGLEIFSAGPRPEYRHALAAFHLTAATRFELIARGGFERATVDGIDSDAFVMGLGIRFTPAAQAY